MYHLSLLIKRIRYYLSALSLIRIVSNWPVIPLVHFRLINISKGVVINLRNGYKFKIYNDLELLILKETFLENDYPFTPTVTKSIVIDIGSNIGDFTVYAAGKNPGVLVYSIEASKKTFLTLQENIKMNHLDGQVIALNLAIYKKNGKMKLYNAGPSGLRSLYKNRREKNFELVNTITLKELFTRYKIPCCDYLKMDCEGAEYDILGSCPGPILKRINEIALEFHEFSPGQKHSQIIKILEKHNFQLRCWYHPLEKGLGYIYASR